MEEYSKDVFTCMMLNDQLDEEDIYHHVRRCMCHVELEEVHPSLGELSQPFFISLGMGGGLPMRPSTYMSRAYGKGVVYTHYNFYVVQATAARRSTLFSRPHGLDEAISLIDGHSLRGLGEEIYYGGHAHSKSYIIQFLHTYDEIGVAGKWLRSHSLYQSLL